MGSGEEGAREESSPEPAGERGMFVLRAVSFPAVQRMPVPQLPRQDLSVAGPTQARLPILPRRLPGILRKPASRPAMARLLRQAWVTELDRGAAFVLAPAFMTAGATGYYALRVEPDILPLLFTALLLAPMLLATRSRPAVNLALGAVLLAVLGAFLAKAETLRAGTKMLGAEITTQLTGRVAEIEHMASGRVRLTIDVTSTARPVLRHAPDRVRISARSVPEDLQAGSVVSGLVRLLPPSGPVRPGSYDFAFESYFDGIGASGFFLRGPALAAEPGSAPVSARFRASVEAVRYAVADRIRSRIGGPQGEIAAALVVGVRAGIPDDVNEALRRAGIYHIISISGLHMALVAGAIMGLLRFGFALFPGFSSRWPVKRLAAVLAIGGLAAYLFISGGEVAAQRSFIMLTIMLTAVLFDRAALTLRNLAISAILVIIVSPHEVVGPSFQMSFAATAALVGAYAAWSDHRRDRQSRRPRSSSVLVWMAGKLLAATAGIAVTSLVAGGATAIYSAWHFQQLPSLGLFTNLATMPIISIVMLFAVLATVLMPLGLDGPFLDVVGIGLGATITIARWFSERATLDMIGLVPADAVIVVTLAILVATVSTTWLRAAAIPLALAGMLLLDDRPRQPDLLISEDARLLGLAVGNGRIAVNRPRPNDFTTDNWQRTLAAETLLKPDRAAPLLPDAIAAVSGGGISGFLCSADLCAARHPSGALVVHAADRRAAARACATASVIVVADATAEDVCPFGRVLVVTKRDLARRGSAAVTLLPEIAASSPNARHQGTSATAAVPQAGFEALIEYAVRRPYRPWHGHRRFSREARGLPPYRRAGKPTSVPATRTQ